MYRIAFRKASHLKKLSPKYTIRFSHNYYIHEVDEIITQMQQAIQQDEEIEFELEVIEEESKKCIYLIPIRLTKQTEPKDKPLIFEFLHDDLNNNPENEEITPKEREMFFSHFTKFYNETKGQNSASEKQETVVSKQPVPSDKKWYSNVLSLFVKNTKQEEVMTPSQNENEEEGDKKENEEAEEEIAPVLVEEQENQSQECTLHVEGECSESSASSVIEEKPMVTDQEKKVEEAKEIPLHLLSEEEKWYRTRKQAIKQFEEEENQRIQLEVQTSLSAMKKQQCETMKKFKEKNSFDSSKIKQEVALAAEQKYKQKVSAYKQELTEKYHTLFSEWQEKHEQEKKSKEKELNEEKTRKMEEMKQTLLLEKQAEIDRIMIEKENDYQTKLQDLQASFVADQEVVRDEIIHDREKEKREKIREKEEALEKEFKQYQAKRLEEKEEERVRQQRQLQEEQAFLLEQQRLQLDQQCLELKEQEMKKELELAKHQQALCEQQEREHRELMEKREREKYELEQQKLALEKQKLDLQAEILMYQKIQLQKSEIGVDFDITKMHESEAKKSEAVITESTQPSEKKKSRLSKVGMNLLFITMPIFFFLLGFFSFVYMAL